MFTLFIDTTKYITVGLLDDDYNWLDYHCYKELKASAAVHYKIYEILSKNNLDVEELNEIVYVAGPGSYTGMRVSAGIADVFKTTSIPVYSFYHFQVPLMIGIESGVWKNEAFKNEVFVYKWNGDANNSKLVKVQNDDSQITYTSFSKSINYSTDSLIFNNPKKIFSKVIFNKNEEELYYYRSIDDEYGAKV